MSEESNEFLANIFGCEANDVPEFDMPELPEWETKPADEVIALSQEIETDKVGEEVLTWLANSVENFIDNQERIYRIDILLDDTDVDELEDIGNIKALQNLYRAIPDETMSTAFRVAPAGSSPWTQAHCSRIFTKSILPFLYSGRLLPMWF